MAYAKITVHYPDSTAVIVEVGHETAHPDLLDELCARVAVLYRMAVPDQTDETTVDGDEAS